MASVRLLRVAVFLLVLLVLVGPGSYGYGISGRVLGQSIVVEPEDVSTPTPVPVLLPTVTPAFSTDGRPGDKIIDDDGESYAGPYGRSYVVQEGDTLWSVALEIGVDLDVMPCLVDPYYRPEIPLVIGATLFVPAGQIVCHEALDSETILSIAAQYQVEPALIIGDAWNGLEHDVDLDRPLDFGRFVRVISADSAPVNTGLFGYLLGRPVGEPPMVAYATGGPTRNDSRTLVPDDWPYGSGDFEWPTYGWITQGYRNDHRAVDIAARTGTFVTAADRGEVVRAGWNNQGYGMFVIIDHNIDYVTLYSHLQEVYVKEGDIVAQGQVIGTVGSTGNSTGPHLHFEVRDFGSRINPLEVLVR